MPIIQIHAHSPANPEAVTRLIHEIRETGAKVFSSVPTNFWVQFLPLRQPVADVSDPPVVFIKANRGRSTELQTALVKAVSVAVARALSMAPEQIWVQYEELDPTRLWFGGKWTG